MMDRLCLPPGNARTPPCIAAGTAWESMWTPFNGKKVRLRITSQARNAPPSRNPESQVWCKRMLEEGVAACVGPTSEPYVQAFPVPDIFFGLLADGHLSLVECYFAATALFVLANGAHRRSPVQPLSFPFILVISNQPKAQVSHGKPKGCQNPWR